MKIRKTRCSISFFGLRRISLLKAYLNEGDRAGTSQRGEAFLRLLWHDKEDDVPGGL